MSTLKLSVDVGENYNDPLEFVRCAVVAEKYGFDTIWFGDHFLPWFHKGNRSAYVWSVMPVALERTTTIKVGPDVTSPIGGRFHPAIVAQAAATLDNMYPGRFPLGVGSGEAINEMRFFSSFPNWKERIERLTEAIDLMRQLWDNQDYFSFNGKFFKMKDVFLYTKPKSRIPIYFSAIGEKAISYAASHGDHLVTMGSVEKCSETIFPTFESAARSAGKDPSKMEKMVLVDIYFGNKEEGVRKLKETGEAGPLAADAVREPDPRRIERMASTINVDEIANMKYFCSTPSEIIELVSGYSKAGATHIAIATNSFPETIRMIGEKVLPYFSKR